jgi:hypothetical protein
MFILSSLIIKSLLAILTLIIVDTILGILISFKRKQFDLSLVPLFLASNVLPYMGGLIVLALLSVYLSLLDPDLGSLLEYLYYTAAATVGLKFSKEALLDKIKQLFSALPEN